MIKMVRLGDIAFAYSVRVDLGNRRVLVRGGVV
jgi:hypothetical protein